MTTRFLGEWGQEVADSLADGVAQQPSEPLGPVGLTGRPLADAFTRAAFGLQLPAAGAPAHPHSRSLAGRLIAGAANLLYIVCFGAFTLPTLILAFAARMALFGLVSGWSLAAPTYQAIQAIGRDPLGDSAAAQAADEASDGAGGQVMYAGDAVDYGVDDDHEM